MKCPKCGKEIANDSVFCEFCGQAVSTQPQSGCVQPSPPKTALLRTGLVVCCVVIVGLIIAVLMLYSQNNILQQLPVEVPQDTLVNLPADNPIEDQLLMQIDSLESVIRQMESVQQDLNTAKTTAMKNMIPVVVAYSNGAPLDEVHISFAQLRAANKLESKQKDWKVTSFKMCAFSQTFETNGKEITDEMKRAIGKLRASDVVTFFVRVSKGNESKELTVSYRLK